MRHPSPLIRALRATLVGIVPSALLLLPAAGMAQTVIPLGSFRSVTLRSGGEVIVRYAPTQRVTLLEGTGEYTNAVIVDGDRLVIDRCPDRCPEGYQLAVEILTPKIDEIRVQDGGTIRTSGRFPRQAELRAAVASGGTIDVRSMAAGRVTAAIRDGGRILARPEKTLLAKVAHGGAVVYWGTPHDVTSSIEKGGVVAKGAAADADRPLHELGPEITAVPAVPPVPRVPPVPPARTRGTI